MKIGEALTLRAQQAGKLADLRSRISGSTHTQEGTDPAESTRGLLDAYEQLSHDHSQLVLSINRANVESGLQQRLLRREHLRRLKNSYEAALGSARSATAHSYYGMRTELKTIVHVDVVELQSTVDELEEQIRVIDTEIQQLNWTTEL